MDAMNGKKMHRAGSVVTRGVLWGLAAALLLTGSPTIYASGESVVIVTVAGQLTGYGVSFTVEANVRGTVSALEGRGVISPFHGEVLSVGLRECRFSLVGSISGSVVTLTGQALDDDTCFGSTFPGPITVTGDASSGAISLSRSEDFDAYFGLGTGTGTVVILD